MSPGRSLLAARADRWMDRRVTVTAVGGLRFDRDISSFERVFTRTGKAGIQHHTKTRRDRNKGHGTRESCQSPEDAIPGSAVGRGDAVEFAYRQAYSADITLQQPLSTVVMNLEVLRERSNNLFAWALPARSWSGLGVCCMDRPCLGKRQGNLGIRLT
jgi:hypothetical protein